MIDINTGYDELLEYIISLKPILRPTYKDFDEYDVVDDSNRPIGSVTGYKDRQGRLVYSVAIRGNDIDKKQAGMLLPPIIQMTGNT